METTKEILAAEFGLEKAGWLDKWLTQEGLSEAGWLNRYLLGEEYEKKDLREMASQARNELYEGGEYAGEEGINSLIEDLIGEYGRIGAVVFLAWAKKSPESLTDYLFAGQGDLVTDLIRGMMEEEEEPLIFME